MMEIPVPAEPVTPKSCKPHVIGAFIAAVLASGLYDRNSKKFFFPVRDGDKLILLGRPQPFPSTFREPFWIEVTRICTLLSDLSRHSEELTADEIAAVIAERLDFDKELGDIYLLLVVLAIASLR